jgi:CRISPR-associated protein Csb1
VIVEGEIVRTTIVNLTALRALGAETAEQESTLRRYILGLTLVAAFAPADLFLRQGCLLISARDKAPDTKLVYRDGRREPFVLAPDQMEQFAQSAAQAFVVGENRSVDFDSKVAKKLLKDASKAKEES